MMNQSLPQALTLISPVSSPTQSHSASLLQKELAVIQTDLHYHLAVVLPLAPSFLQQKGATAGEKDALATLMQMMKCCIWDTLPNAAPKHNTPGHRGSQALRVNYCTTKITVKEENHPKNSSRRYAAAIWER